MTIHHNPHIPPEILHTLQQLQPEEFLVSHTTQWFDRWLAKSLPNTGVTAHSIKSGAIEFLARQVVAGKLDIDMLPERAKHKTTGRLPPLTIR